MMIGMSGTSKPRDWKSSSKGFNGGLENPNLLEYVKDEEEIAKQSVPIPDRGHGIKPRSSRAMDPFEVRIRFTNHLQHLNASVTSSQKAAQYALKYRDMDEDLHSCILEQLERVRYSLSRCRKPRLI